jgi:hypothetical protein
MAKKDSHEEETPRPTENERPNDTPDLEDAMRSIDAIGEGNEAAE